MKLLVYSDDAPSTSHDQLDSIEGMRESLKLKGEKAEIPEVHLGRGIAEVKSANRTKSKTLSSAQNVKSDVANVEIKVDESGMRLLSKLSTLFSSDCCPSEAELQELCIGGVTLFQE